MQPNAVQRELWVTIDGVTTCVTLSPAQKEGDYRLLHYHCSAGEHRLQIQTTIGELGVWRV